MRWTAYVMLIALAGCAHRNRSQVATVPDVSMITAEDIDRAPGLSLEQLLATRVPGISLSRAADGHLVIHIRGTNTLLGDEEPLFVINGIPLENPVGGNLASLSRRDIEYIQVLRDPASTAMYGVRGANGVILIKMRQS